MEVKKKISKKYKPGKWLKSQDFVRSLCQLFVQHERRNKGLSAAAGVMRVSEPHVLEKLLLVWTNEKQPAGGTMTKSVTCEKAKTS